MIFRIVGMGVFSALALAGVVLAKAPSPAAGNLNVGP